MKNEQAINHSEHGETLLPTGEIEKLLEATTDHSPAERQAEVLEQQAALEHARTAAETVERDDPLARLQASEALASNQAPAPPPDKFLKKQSLSRELRTLQRKESAPARSLSRVIHQPVVRLVSDVAGKTISRPSGLLGGGVVAFLGSSVYLYLAYHVGFTYRPTVFLLLLVAGFAVGIVLELLIRLIRRSQTSA